MKITFQRKEKFWKIPSNNPHQLHEKPIFWYLSFPSAPSVAASFWPRPLGSFPQVWGVVLPRKPTKIPYRKSNGWLLQMGNIPFKKCLLFWGDKLILVYFFTVKLFHLTSPETVKKHCLLLPFQNSATNEVLNALDSCWSIDASICPFIHKSLSPKTARTSCVWHMQCPWFFYKQKNCPR